MIDSVIQAMAGISSGWVSRGHKTREDLEQELKQLEIGINNKVDDEILEKKIFCLISFIEWEVKELEKIEDLIYALKAIPSEYHKDTAWVIDNAILVSRLATGTTQLAQMQEALNRSVLLRKSNMISRSRIDLDKEIADLDKSNK